MAKKLVKKFAVRHESVGRVEVPIKFDTEANVFLVEADQPCGLRFHHKEIAQVEEYIKATIIAELAVKWKPFLYVEVEVFTGKRFSSDKNSEHRSLALTYRTIDLGTRPNGTKISRSSGESSHWARWPEVGLVNHGTRNDDPVTKCLR